MELKLCDGRTLNFPNNNFNLAFSYQTLQQVPTKELLAQNLKEIHLVLKPGGLLLLNTPDASSALAKLLGSHWHLLVPPEHLHYFNKNNLSRLLTANGFKVMLAGRLGKKFTLAYIFKTLHQWQKLSLWKNLGQASQRGWLAKIALPLNLRDNILIIVRKK